MGFDFDEGAVRSPGRSEHVSESMVDLTIEVGVEGAGRGKTAELLIPYALERAKAVAMVGERNSGDAKREDDGLDFGTMRGREKPSTVEVVVHSMGGTSSAWAGGPGWVSPAAAAKGLPVASGHAAPSPKSSPEMPMGRDPCHSSMRARGRVRAGMRPHP